MVRKKKCSLCKININMDQNEIQMKCPFCSTFAHKECAENNNAICLEHFYCNDHLNLRPASSIRTDRPQNVITSIDRQQLIQNIAAASAILQSEDPEAGISINQQQIAVLANSVSLLNELLEQSKVSSQPLPDKTNNENFANSTSINSSKNDETENHDPAKEHRIPNCPPDFLLPHPFTPDCNKCRLKIDRPFFKCLNCKYLWHDKCVTGDDRNRQIRGFWVCSICKSQHDEHEKIINYQGERASMLQKKDERVADMYANLKVDDPFFSQPRISQFPFRFPAPIEIPQIQKPQTNEPIDQPKEIPKDPTQLNEMISEKLSLEKAIEELNARKLELEFNLNHPISSERQPNVQINALPNNPQHPFASSNDSSFSPSQEEIQRMVEESLQRMNIRQHDASHELSRKLIENQLHESQKKTYYTLPKVSKVGYEWKIFYTAFTDSMSLFTPNENVVRLQNAIQCPEIKKLGGINLFMSATFEQTLKEIDRRIGKPEKLLIREKQKLIGFNKLGNSDTKETMDFIQEVKAYSTLVDKIGNFGDKNDQALIARLSRILPERLLNMWTKEYSKIKEDTEEVLVSDLSSWLDKQIDTFETSLLFNQMDPYGDLKQKNALKNTIQQGSKAKENKKESFFLHKTEDKVESNKPQKASLMNHSTNGDNDSPAIFCWYHNRKGHSSLNCFTLLSKNGDEVQELAKTKGICTICGCKNHQPCPQKEKYTCPIPECQTKHAVIFCPKRRCQQITAIPTRNRRQSSNGSTNRRRFGNNYSHHIRQTNANDTNCNAESSQTTFDALQLNTREVQNKNYHESWMMIREIQMQTSCQSNFNAPNQIPLTSPTLVSVVVVTLENAGRTLKCALLLDSGSTTSLIEEEYADLLHLKGPKKKMKISWSGGTSRIIEDSMIVRANATGIHENAKTFDIYFRTVKNLEMPPQDFNADELRKKFKYLKDLPLASYSRLIGVIGVDQWRFFKQQKWIESQNKESIDKPAAFLSPLGYCVIGSSCPLSTLHQHMSNFHIEEFPMSYTYDKISKTEEEELIKMEERALGLEYHQPYENDRLIEDDQAGLKQLMEKVKYIPEMNLYEAPLMWNTPDVVLPTEESFRTAYRRLKILLNNAERMGNYLEIKAQIENLLAKEYARRLREEEIKAKNPKAFYIPIFVSCPKGKRPRMIWDCAAKINGKSLNDFLYTGPNLYNDLLDITIRFREGKYFVKSDVMEMFHQIQICPEDRPALRFLFAESADAPVEHYEMNRMIFGSACSPTTSQFVKNTIAKSFESSYPEAAKAIIESMYVDDFVHSFNDINYGKKLINDARSILKSGGFNLMKLKANHPEILETVLENLSEEEKSNPKILSLEEKEKLLGYLIDFNKDAISLVDFRKKFSDNLLDGTKVPTKKELLKFLMTLYDPLGLFVFFTSKMKLIYHWVCKENIEWDEHINEKQMGYWLKILKWLPEIINLQIPRSYLNEFYIHPHEKLEYQLIIMGDAGKESLCTAAYIRVKSQSQVTTQLVASKNFIVPKKQKRTIPELELDIACKSVKFKEKLIKAHSITFDRIVFTTDSSCVYNWIVNGTHKPTIYMHNRLKKIKELSNKDQWTWIQSELQVADYGTKFDSFPSITNDSEWFKPDLFRLPEDDWIQSKPPNETAEISHHVRNSETNNWIINCLGIILMFLQSCPYIARIINYFKAFLLIHFPWLFQIPLSNEMWHYTTENNEDVIPFVAKYSSWNKLLRMTQMLLRWKWKVQIKKAKKIKMDNESILKWESTKFQESYAEMMIIKKAQWDCYAKEIKELNKGNKVSQKSKLFKYSPFLDERGVLRITTRLSSSNNYSRDKITPIVLPNNHLATELIVMQYHESNHHSHFKTIIANLMQRFHIPNITWTTRRIIKENCFRCKRFNAKPDTPMMGDLPSYRLATHINPFTYSVVDICGPFKISMNRRYQKRWLFVISCLTTRAIHMEVLYSMSSQSCLMAFTNFINLRGAPLRVVSDQGSNFIGSNNIRQDMETKWNKKLKEKNVITQDIEWDFNPAKASSMSGSVERMIGLIKSVLRNLHDTLNKKLIIPSDEEFKCLVCEIIGMLNNRPLTMLPIKDTNNCFLTPNYFLQLRPNFQSTPSNKVYNKCTIKEWQDIKSFVNVLWDHFSKVYISEIMHRDKWIDFKKPLAIGDLVILADPSVNKLWRLGVIKEIHEGSQNQVRKVTVRLGKRSVINDHSNKNHQALMNEYKKEKYTEVTRPTSQVAPLNLFVSDMF